MSLLDLNIVSQTSFSEAGYLSFFRLRRQNASKCLWRVIKVEFMYNGEQHHIEELRQDLWLLQRWQILI